MKEYWGVWVLAMLKIVDCVWLLKKLESLKASILIVERAIIGLRVLHCVGPGINAGHMDRIISIMDFAPTFTNLFG